MYIYDLFAILLTSMCHTFFIHTINPVQQIVS